MSALPVLGSLGAPFPVWAAAGNTPLPRPQNQLTPNQALARLQAGNQRYRSNLNGRRDFSGTRAALTRGQNPYASILGCADSRVSPELCFDESRGDLFVTRVAGNYVTPDLLASLEYGAAVLNTPLIMVLGHTQCGAVSAAIEAEEQLTDFPGHIQSLATALAPAVRDAMATETTPAKLNAAVTRANVLRNVALLEQATPILRQRVKTGALKVVGGIYHLDTGAVEVL